MGSSHRVHVVESCKLDILLITSTDLYLQWAYIIC